MAKEPLLSARDIEIEFSLRGKILKAIRKCSLDLYEGETLAIVGESGSGKSVFTKSFLGMLDANGSITGGSIVYDGVDISKYKTEKEWLTIRGKKISMVMQDPMTSLNPLKKIGKQIQESIELCQGIKGEEAKKLSIEMLKKVGIPDPERRANQYPHEFSGGMRQRVVIAIAVACRPQILICDEPTTALDVTIQAQVLEMIHALKRKSNTAMLLITHDLGVVAQNCDSVAIIYAGEIVEYGTLRQVYKNVLHPYTEGLFGSVPSLESNARRLAAIDGMMPDPTDLPKGCKFVDRCKYATDRCRGEVPRLMEMADGHKVRCFRHESGEVNGNG